VTNLPSSLGAVIGFGLDAVELDDFSRLLSEPASNFLSRYFTQQELETAGNGPNKGERLAGRFAVKEAVMKALGVGLGDGVAFYDVEVITKSSGAPSVELHRSLEAIASERRVCNWLITITHTKRTAIAGAIALRET